MPIVADAGVAVRADMAPFNRELKSGLGKAEKSATSFGSKFKAALTPGNLLGAAGIGVGIAQITSFIGDATAAAAEFEDSVSAVGVIFGEEMVPQMEAWGEAAHSSFGASKQDALAAANVIATLGKAAGLAGQELVDFSQQMVQLGGDLASMYGGTTKDAIDAVSSALRGEFEPIRRYGVILDDATLRQKAFEMGLISTTKNALTPQQKVLASQAAILASTGDAQGDFERTADGMANSQRDLAAELANVNIEIGEKMLPIMLKLVNFVKDEALPVLRDFLDMLSGEGEPIDIGQVIEDEFPVGANSPLGQFSAWFNRTWDGVLGREDEIVAAAERMGLSYDEMHSRILHGMNTGADFTTALDEAMSGINLETSRRVPHRVAAAIREGAPAVDAEALAMARGIPLAMQEGQDAAVEVAAQTPGALGDSLRENLSDYQDDLDALTDMAVNSVSDLKERQTIEGVLASRDLTDALNSDSTRTRLQAMELVNDLVADYELLAPGALGAGQLVNPQLARGMQSNLNLTTAAAGAIVDAAGNPLVAINAYPWGYQIGSELAAGMWASMHLISDAAYAMANTVARQVRIESEPPDHSSPLYGHMKWGGNFVQDIVGGMLGGVGGVRGAARALASGLVPSMTVGGGMAMAGAGAGSGPTFILQVEGQPPYVGTREDVIGRWAQMSGFSDRSMT